MPSVRLLRSVFALLAVASVSAPSFSPAQSGQPRSQQAASVDTALFRGMRYRLVGPPRGGRVTAVTGVPGQPRTFYMGVASGGVFRTTDGGQSWVPITDHQVPPASIGDIAVSLSDPNIIYVGTGSDGVRSNVSTGRGVYKSTDNGRTWSFVGLYNVGQIGAVRIHPTNPDIVWVAANGDIFKPNADRGIFKTTDGGRTWRKTLYLNDSTGAMDVEVMPGNPDVVYAWMNRIERKPWTIISGSRAGGFYKSTNGGETWTRITTGLPNELIGKGNLAVTAANPQRIYALVEALPGGGLYRSDNGGQSWAMVNDNPQLVQRPFYYTTIGADPGNADIVYAGAESFFKSVDGGVTLARFPTPHTDNHDIWISPNDGNTMVQANDGGVNVSFDGGRTWSTQNNQVTSEMYQVWTDNEFPYNLYGAQQDNSTWIISSISSPFDANSIQNAPGCETGPVMPHTRDPNIVYGNCKGQFSWLNRRTGQEKNYWVGAQSLYGNAARDLIYRMQRVTPMATSPHDPEIVYYGSQYLHRTRDRGVTWETISPDLTWNPPHAQGVSGGPITRDGTGEEFYATLYAITESPHEAGVIWTGSNDGPFHVTRDNGKTWTNITPKDLPEGGRVAWIEASPHRPGSAYYAVYRFLLGDYAPYIYRTDDYGQTWTRLTSGSNGIPADWPTRAIREDPGREGLLYAGTEFGMFISFDNGGHWQPFRLNMPHVPINDIKVHNGDLIVATQGRALWILDNVSALHQLTSATRASELVVYNPRPSYRTRAPLNAFYGPMIDYYLPSAPAGDVRIEILDEQGKPVNEYSSATPTGGRGAGGRGGRGGGGGGGRGAGGRGGVDPDGSDAVMMAGRSPAEIGSAPSINRVTKNAGFNRFVWDVGHSNGLGAPPGRYQARVQVGNESRTVGFLVRVDPRLAEEGITEADLRFQFEHNVRTREMVADVNALVQRVRAAESRLQNASGRAAADSLARVRAIAQKLITEPIRYGRPGLQAQISYLAGIHSRVDQKVSKDAIDRAVVLRRELDAIRMEADRVLGGIIQ